MKILQINSVCGVGSTGRICTDVALLLSSRGDECKIAYGREFVPLEYQKYSVRIGNRLDVSIHGIETRIFDNTGFGSRRVTKEFIKWVDAYDPDIIHLHNLHGYYINIEILFEYLKNTNKPIVWTLHDCWAFTGHCTHFDAIGCDKWMSESCSRCPQKKEYPKSIIFDNSSRNLKRKRKLFGSLNNLMIIVPSLWLQEKVKNSILKKYPVKVIPSGIDLKCFSYVKNNIHEKYNLENKKIVLGVASSWNESKGLKHFVKLSQLLSDEYQIVLVGIDDIKAKALSNKLLGISKTNNIEELAEIYSAAYVFLNLSSQETQGLTTIEAMACGTPVIVYNRTALPEVVDETVGFVVEYGDYQSLVTNINNVVTLSSQDCVKKARMYDKESCFKKYVTIYDHLEYGLGRK